MQKPPSSGGFWASRMMHFATCSLRNRGKELLSGLTVCEVVDEVATGNLWLVSNSGKRVDRTLLHLFLRQPILKIYDGRGLSKETS
jgi:hypothetical protein